MKPILSIIGFFMVLLLSAGVTSAMNVTAVPSSVLVGENVSVNVSTSPDLASCTINVDFDDGTTTFVNCAGTVPYVCTNNLNHIYSTSGNYTITASSDCVLSPTGAPLLDVDTASVTVTFATPATSELTITRLQLSFDNGRAETTVNRNQPGLRANADLRFDGSGLLKGYWEVDGRVLSQVNQHLTYGKSIRLTSPAVPFLPTFVEGSHRVRLVITNPVNNIPFPEAIYYVTSEESTAGLAPLRTAEPRNHADLAFVPQSFRWEGTTRAAMYLVEFFEREGEVPVAAAYTKGTAYDLPEAILTESFDSGKAYMWWVKSYDAEGNLVGASELAHFIFQ
ncbi:MAG: hypothetical protein KAT93_02520 [Desulfuromonadales bacterium]|nr:hypothetical protein [Desulfuromonadales bacterium]